MIRTTIFALLAGTAMAGASFAQQADTPRPASPITQFDTDGDGRISRAEAEAMGRNPMAMADANGDGIVTRDEVVAAAVARATDRAEARAGRMFDRFDEDANGEIAVDNLPGPRGDRGDRIARMFERADTDSDGFLSEDEIADMPRHGMDGHHGRGGPRWHRG